MSGDIQTIKSQLNKIKNLIKKERQGDKNIIKKLSSQLKEINNSVSKLEKMAKRIKGGKIRALKQRGGNCPFILDDDNKGGRKRRRRQKK